MKSVLVSLIAIAIVAGLSGCGQGDQSQTSSTPAAAASSGNKTAANGATIVNSPTSEVPAGGIVLQPSNPDDPKYKPDPKLAGGG